MAGGFRECFGRAVLAGDGRMSAAFSAYRIRCYGGFFLFVSGGL